MKNTPIQNLICPPSLLPRLRDLMAISKWSPGSIEYIKEQAEHISQLSKTISPLNQQQWEKLEKLADAAKSALETLSVELLIASGNADDPALAKLAEESKKVHNVTFGFLGGYFYHPQPEWLGGEKSVLREPHILPACSNRRTIV
jgi:hypothetical protein